MKNEEFPIEELESAEDQDWMARALQKHKNISKGMAVDLKKQSMEKLDEAWSKIKDGNPLKKQIEKEIERRMDEEGEDTEKALSPNIEKALDILGL